MATGRGAWTTGGKDNNSRPYRYFKVLPMDGSSPKKGVAYAAVNLGVKAIQVALNGEGCTPKLTADGVFGPKSETAVTWYQGVQGLKADGVAGATMCRLLWNKAIRKAADEAGVDPRYLFGQMIHESSGDPSACGFYHEQDRGLCQINTQVYGDVSLAEAHDTEFALAWSAARMKTAMDRFGGKGADLQLKCALLQHQSPAGAATLYQTGAYETSLNSDYVDDVVRESEGWTV